MTKEEFIRSLIEKTNAGNIKWQLERNTHLFFIPNPEQIVRDFFTQIDSYTIYVVEKMEATDEYGADSISIVIYVLNNNILQTRIYPIELSEYTYEEFLNCIQANPDAGLANVFANMK